MDDVPGARMLLPIFDCTADLPVALGETRSATPKAAPTHGQGNGHTPAAADRPVRRLECPIARAEAGKAPGFAVQEEKSADLGLGCRRGRAGTIANSLARYLVMLDGDQGWPAVVRG
jgi:hypothetical protein